MFQQACSIFFIAALLMCGCCSTACCQSFWAGTKFGDSISTVQSKIQSTSPAVALTELRKGSQDSGELDALVRQGITSAMTTETSLVGVPFGVLLYFSKDGLERVLLSKRNSSTSRESQQIAIKLSRLLRTKYGSPRSMSNEKEGTLSFFYRSGQTLILFYTGPVDSENRIFVSYTLFER